MASINKRIHRLLRFVELLQSGRHYKCTQLADICEVSRRTVFRDIRTLRDSGVDVQQDQKRGGYHLPAWSFRLTKDLLHDELTAAFILCSSMDDAQEAVPFSREARLAVGKLAAGQSEQYRDLLYRAAEVVTIQITPRSVLPPDNANFKAVLQAAIDRRCVRIQYEDSSTSKPVTTLFSPYRLVFRGSGWCVVGRSSIHRSIRAIDFLQFLRLETTEQRYQIPSRFDLDRFFRFSWRLTNEGATCFHVVVRFQKAVAEEVGRSRWHPSQRIVHSSDGTIDFEVTVDRLNELERWILGFGADAKVLQPARLREMLVERARQMVCLYGEPPKRVRLPNMGQVTETKAARM